MKRTLSAWKVIHTVTDIPEDLEQVDRWHKKQSWHLTYFSMNLRANLWLDHFLPHLSEIPNLTPWGVISMATINAFPDVS